MMNLDFSEQESAFRAECRGWLEANVPKESLPSGDTREGYALHLEWERKLFDAAQGVLSRSRAQRLIDAVSQLEKIDRVGELMALTVADTRGES